MGKIWKAREATCKLAASVTITTGNALDTFFSVGTDITADLKDITIQEPGYDPDKIDLCGEDADGFQNADWDEKTYDVGTLKATIVMRGDEQIETLIYGAGTDIGGTHTRYRPGDGSRLTPAILVNLDDASDEINFVLDNAHYKLGERKLTADGHAEYDFECKCLPTDFFGPEFKD